MVSLVLFKDCFDVIMEHRWSDRLGGGI